MIFSLWDMSVYATRYLFIRKSGKGTGSQRQALGDWQ